MRSSPCCSRTWGPDVDGSSATTEQRTPLVDIRGLSTVFATPEKTFVVHENLDLTVWPGEVLSIVGGSGTGKTVLLRQMLGLETPAAGEVRVLGQPLAQLGQK